MDCTFTRGGSLGCIAQWVNAKGARALGGATKSREKQYTKASYYY